MTILIEEVDSTVKVQSVRFGEMNVSEQNVFTFSQGLPGFESNKQFVVLQAPDDLPFYFMQSIDDAELAFVITDPFLFYKEYTFDLPEAVQQELDVQRSDQVQVWSIVSIDTTGGLECACTNLMAPIVVNKDNNQCRQIILHNTTYGLKHPLIFQAESKPIGSPDAIEKGN